MNSFKLMRDTKRKEEEKKHFFFESFFLFLKNKTQRGEKRIHQITICNVLFRDGSLIILS